MTIHPMTEILMQPEFDEKQFLKDVQFVIDCAHSGIINGISRHEILEIRTSNGQSSIVRARVQFWKTKAEEQIRKLLLDADS